MSDAILLTLGLFLVLATALQAADPADPAGPSEQAEQSVTIAVGEGDDAKKVEMRYLLFVPKDYDKDGRAVPLMLFLHGAGERGEDLQLVAKHGPPKIVKTKKDFPFIVVSPQCPRGRFWRKSNLLGLIDHIVATYNVDASRVYVTGLSMGGFGTWVLTADQPQRFAAAVPICGGGDPDNAKQLVDVPIWAFHGGKDQVVQLARSEAMVDAIREAGGAKVKLTVYPEAGHDSWTATYDNPEVYKWLLSHKRQKGE